IAILLQHSFPTRRSSDLNGEPQAVPTNDIASPITATSSETSQVQHDLRETGDTLLIRRTIRSGQAIHHPSNIVILGDVNPGAERSEEHTSELQSPCNLVC